MRGVSRRRALLGLGGAVTLGGRVRVAFADAPTRARLVVVLLRGALDGMGAVIPYGDPALMGLRGAIVPRPVGQPEGMLDLGGFYGLHPALGGLHGMYRAGEALAVHAVGGPSRSRSHFDAQDCLECGADHRLDSGWLNRAVAAVPGPRPAAGLALSVGVATPLLLRGPGRLAAWAPGAMGAPPADFYARVAALHQADALTGPAIDAALAERAAVRAAGPGGGGFAGIARTAGRLLAADDGPRVAALELGGWDTHAAQKNRLGAALGQLDAGLVGLREGLGAAWARSAVLVITEFGRTAHVNGTAGTDHGTATVAFIVGGAVAGGRVGGTWPGLARAQLWEGRDLAPTADVRGLAKGLLVAHLGVPAAAMAAIFPGAEAVAPAAGLLRV